MMMVIFFAVKETIYIFLRHLASQNLYMYIYIYREREREGGYVFSSATRAGWPFPLASLKNDSVGHKRYET